MSESKTSVEAVSATAAVTTTAQRRRPVAASANGEARRRATSPVIKIDTASCGR